MCVGEQKERDADRQTDRQTEREVQFVAEYWELEGEERDMEETGPVNKRRRLWVYCRVEEEQRRSSEKGGTRWMKVITSERFKYYQASC